MTERMRRRMGRPIVVLSVGDPAGIGPEVAVGAALSPRVREEAVPILVGFEAHLRRAMEVVQQAGNLRPAGCVRSWTREVEPSTVLFHAPDPGAAPGVEPGCISAASGRCAARAFEAGVKLALQHPACGLATAPVNKEALALSGAPYLEHTAGLVQLTDSAGARTMFQTGRLRIFFISRHCSLRQALDLVTVERVIRRTLEAVGDLDRLDIDQPRLALAALNPHAGDGGLFGDEEETVLAPAVRELRARGVDIEGPIPADAVFHLGAAGRYDAVLSLYHDQGHIAAKTLDFHGTISFTLGLPFLRTSVDHGTALDLAGTGRASSRSMEEAVLAAARWGPRWQRKEGTLK